MVAGFARIPILVILAVSLVLTLLESRFLILHFRWKESHLGNAPIKEAVDSLPVGICCYEENGQIVLKNTTMETICRRFTGEALLNGRTFEKEMDERCISLEERQILAGDTGVYAMEKQEISSKGRPLWVLTASDITEEYRKMQELSAKRQAVLLLNEKLNAYNKEIASVITQREILHAKIQVHDVMGSTLLMSNRYITDGGSEEMKEKILKELTSGVDYLLAESDTMERDAYRKIFDTAEKLKIRVVVTGTLPEEATKKKILSTAMHECLTNTLRHAGGDTLYVDLKEKNGALQAVFTNNGTQPQKPIREMGGLVSLRSLVESAGGRMEISVKDRFSLRLYFLKEEGNDGI